MGNVLYRWAHLIAYARDNGAEVWDLSRCTDRYFRLFPKLDSKLLPILRERRILSVGSGRLQYLVGKLIRWVVIRKQLTVINNLDSVYDLIEEDLFRCRNEVIIEGFHYDAAGALERHAGYIRSLFSPPDDVLHVAETYIQQLPVGPKVAVHIRRGDYKEWLGGKYFYELEDYQKVLCQVARLIRQRQNKDCVFIIFSDDPLIDMSEFSSVSAIRSDFKYGRDYDWYLMSLCDFIVAPRSTYSGWASFFGEVPLYRLGNSLELSDFNQFSICSRLIDEEVF